jgi:molybdopterin/thiamine biosynthesis adenylyltransferase
MPRVAAVEPSQLDWLRANHQDYTFTEIASRLGVCVDTAKRILVRQGLREFEGSKYVLAQRRHIHTWDRPCLDCRKPEPRPKNWYYCRSCRSRRGFSDE